MEDLNGSAEWSGMVRKRSPLPELRSCEKDSRNCAEQAQDTDCKVTKWTDEKHSLYLNSMESSFVNQLYDSLDMFGWNPQEKRSPECMKSGQKHHAGVPTPSGQFKVFQEGSWTRVNFIRNRPRPTQAYESGNILSNPWIQHYRAPCRNGSTASVTDQEMTDQNFTDEATEEPGRRQNLKPGRRRNLKCRKTSTANELGHDQVVPLNEYELPLLGDLTQKD